MNKDEWIYKRASQLQKAMNERIRQSELNGYPNHDHDDVSYENAEQEWNQMYGTNEEE